MADGRVTAVSVSLRRARAPLSCKAFMCLLLLLLLLHIALVRLTWLVYRSHALSRHTRASMRELCSRSRVVSVRRSPVDTRCSMFFRPKHGGLPVWCFESAVLVTLVDNGPSWHLIPRSVITKIHTNRMNIILAECFTPEINEYSI